jgi:hypothetical protein
MVVEAPFPGRALSLSPQKRSNAILATATGLPMLNPSGMMRKSLLQFKDPN